jgi:hypothetical protein
MTSVSVDEKVVTKSPFRECKDDRWCGVEPTCPYVYNWNNGTFPEWKLIHLQDCEVASRPTLCIDNLPTNVTLLDLSDMFRPFGHVISINMINPTSCKVVYLDSVTANRAMWRIDGGIYNGNTMIVNKMKH